MENQNTIQIDRRYHEELMHEVVRGRRDFQHEFDMRRQAEKEVEFYKKETIRLNEIIDMLLKPKD